VSCVNKEDIPGVRDAVTRASLIFTSSFFATISAAFPFGARIKGTWPARTCKSRAEKGCGRGTVPVVATALKSPLAMRSISSSICCSVEEGALRMRYDELTLGCDGPACADGGGLGGRRREKREADGAMKDRY
jgi:hypothetical protein